jgi:hypothetical protein
MPELDHLVFAAPDLDAGIHHIEALTGVRAVPGGPHPGMGSHNALLTFDAATYFEIIAIDPDQPDPGRPRPFGLDEATGARLAGYAIHPTGGETLEEVAERMRSLGADPGTIRAMSRIKPDGEEIHWRLTIAEASTTGDAGLPFIIDWGDTPSPATTLPSMGSLLGVRISHPDAAVRSLIDGLDLGVETVEGPAGLTALIDSPRGRVEIA